MICMSSNNEKNKNINWLNYYQYNEPKNVFEYLDANLRIAGNNTVRKVADLGRVVSDKLGSEKVEEEFEIAANDIRERTLTTYANMDKYKQGNSAIKNFALDFAGMGITNAADPINVALNKVTLFGKTGGFIFNALENMGEYAYDTWSLHNRNIFEDFRKEDAAGLATTLVATAGFQALNSRIPTVEGGTPLYKETGKKINPVDFDRVADDERAVLDIFQNFGIFETDKKTIYKKIKETKKIREMLFNLDVNTVRYRELSKKLQGLQEYSVLLDEVPEMNNIDKLIKGDKISPAEMFKGFTEVKTNYGHYTADGKENLSNLILEEIGVKQEEIKNLRVRAKKVKEKYVSTVGLDSYDEVAYTRNKYVDRGSEARLMFEKDGDTYLVKASIDEQGNVYAEKYRMGDVAPLDKLSQESLKAETDAGKYLKKLGYSKVVDLKNYSEVLNRRTFGKPQDNYVHSIIDDYHVLLKNVQEIDRIYKDEKFNNKADGIGTRTNIDTKSEMIRAIQPLYKNLMMNLKQLQAEDAEELFKATGMLEPFGNYLWKYCENMEIDPQQFVRALQGREKIVIDGNNNFIKLIKNKLNESVRIKSGSKKDLQIENAYYLDALYNKQDVMAAITQAYKNKDYDFINKLSEFVGKSVDLTEDEARSVGLPWSDEGVVLKDLVFDGTKKEVVTRNYSIIDYPEQMAQAFRNAINATTQQSKKGGGPWDYQSKYQIGQRWGNDGSFDNYAKVFEGYERKPYEIISDVYSTVAKDRLELDKITTIIDDLTDNEKEFSKTTYKSERGAVKALDSDVRTELQRQLRGLKEIVSNSFVESGYKPNLWIDPEQQKLTSSMARQTIKSLFSWKLLGNFNYIREFPLNNLKQVMGGRDLGWKQRYNLLKATIVDPIKVNVQLIRNYRNIKNLTLDKIKDPIVRRRAEIFVENRLANDPIFNDIDKMPLNYKLAKQGQKFMTKLGNIAGTGQSISDVHRVVNSEYAAINYLKDIFPNIDEAPANLKKLLQSNGLDGDELIAIKNRLKSMGDSELMELVWNGKRAANEVDYKIQSLFEQVSDILGRKFNAYESMETMENGGFISDMMFLYKRYSLGAVESLGRNLFTYQGQDGLIRKRFDFNGDFLANYKQVFSGTNVKNIFDFSQAAVGTALLYTGIKWTHGKLSGGTEDERAEAKFEALFSDGAVLPFVTDALQDFALDISGINILFGGGTPLGGVLDMTSARLKRAMSSNTLTSEEKVLYFLAATLSPEFIARGIDNLKLGKSIPSDLTTGSETERMLWKTKYQTLAKIDQIEGTLPIEKAFGGAINWVEFFRKNPDKAYELMNSDKSVDKDVVIAGASGITEMIEEHAELTCIQEILNDERTEFKEKQLKILGLDVDSQLAKMSKIDRKTLNSILAFKGIRDEEEILILMEQFNRSKNKKEFLRAMLEDHELGAYKSYQRLIRENDKEIKRRIAKRNNKAGILAYIETLDIVDNLLNPNSNQIRQQKEVIFQPKKEEVKIINNKESVIKDSKNVIKDTENVIEQPKNDNKELLNKINSQIESPKFKDEVLNYISTDEHQTIKKVLDKVMNKTGVVPEKQLASFIKDVPEFKRKEIKEKVYQILESPYLNEEPIIIASEKDNIEFKPFDIEEQESSSIENKEKNDARSIVADIAKKRYAQGSTEQGVVPLEVVEELTNIDELPKPVKWFIKELKEVNPKTGDKRVKEYHDKVVPKQKLSARDNWCATSLLSAFIDSGYKLKHKTASAQEVYLNKKEKVSLENAEAGNVLVFRNRDKNGKRTWTGHVSMIAYKDDDYVIAIGGNQSATNSNERDGENYISFKVYTTDDFKKKMKRSDLSIIAL